MSAKKPAAAGAERGMVFFFFALFFSLTSANVLDPDLTKLLNVLENAEVVKQKLKEEEIYTLARARTLSETDLEKLGFKMGSRDAILELLHRTLYIVLSPCSVLCTAPCQMPSCLAHHSLCTK